LSEGRERRRRRKKKKIEMIRGRGDLEVIRAIAHSDDLIESETVIRAILSEGIKFTLSIHDVS